MKPRISYNLGSYADADLSDESTYIATSMKGNKNFTNPVPTSAPVRAITKRNPVN